jgi:putative transposase
MRELARTRVRFGYRRLHVLLKRKGWSFGKNLAYRLYCEEGLQPAQQAAAAAQDDGDA